MGGCVYITTGVRACREGRCLAEKTDQATVGHHFTTSQTARSVGKNIHVQNVVNI